LHDARESAAIAGLSLEPYSRISLLRPIPTAQSRETTAHDIQPLHPGETADVADCPGGQRLPAPILSGSVPRGSAGTGPERVGERAIQSGHEIFSDAAMEYHVTYEYSLADAPDDYTVTVSSQLVREIPSNIAPVLLPEFIKNVILQRSPQMANIRRLRILRPTEIISQPE